jgi:D-aspartate ligase
MTVDAHQLPYAIIVGVDSLQGIQAVRIMAKKGVPIIGIVRTTEHFGSRTSLCEKLILSNTKTEKLIDTLLELGPTLPGKAVLFPCTDISVLLISRYRETLAPWYHIALPEEDVLEMLVNKDSFYRYAQEQELLITPTRFLATQADAEAAAHELNFPVVLKPVAKTPEWEKISSKKVHKAEDAASFLELYAHYAGATDGMIVQEWIEGGDDTLYSCNFYCNDHGELLVAFIARKLRQWPPEAGNSSLREECHNDNVLAETHRLVEKVGYRGLGYTEFKQDRRNDRHYILEVNVGRPTGGSAIAEAGGVELLYTMYCDLVGLPLPDQRVQTYQGARWIHLLDDAQSAWYYYRKGELSLNAWRKSWSGRKWYAILSLRDPGPFLYQITTGVRSRFGRKD